VHSYGSLVSFLFSGQSMACSVIGSHKEMIRSHIQDLAEHANLLAKRAMRPACSRGLPFAKRKIEVVRNCLVSRRGGLARGTKQKFAHRSKHRVPSATVSCAAQKRVDKRELYVYIHVL
jgi:hypothetical protein